MVQHLIGSKNGTDLILAQWLKVWTVEPGSRGLSPDSVLASCVLKHVRFWLSFCLGLIILRVEMIRKSAS